MPPRHDHCRRGHRWAGHCPSAARSPAGNPAVAAGKEPKFAAHQTGNNGGVLHSGLYYQPGSEKAKLSVSGLQQMLAFCREHGIAHAQCGKIDVATDESELPRLENLWQRGTANGLQGLRRLTPEQIREIEPHAAGIAAIHVPQEGIVDYPAVCETLGGLIRKKGGEIRLNTRVSKLIPAADAWTIETDAGAFHARFVITCGGLQADRLVRAQAMTVDGKLVEDFHFAEARGILHVVNAPSPAATAALAIGNCIAEKVLTRLK